MGLGKKVQQLIFPGGDNEVRQEQANDWDLTGTEGPDGIGLD